MYSTGKIWDGNDIPNYSNRSNTQKDNSLYCLDQHVSRLNKCPFYLFLLHFINTYSLRKQASKTTEENRNEREKDVAAAHITVNVSPARDV